VAKLRAREPAKSSAYDPAVALEFFSSAGKPQPFAKGATIFSENRVGLPLLLHLANRLIHRNHLLGLGVKSLVAVAPNAAALPEEVLAVT